MGRPRINPRTDDEWQACVDAAQACLLLDSLRQYGLVTGGPKTKADRARRLLEQGARKGFHPREGSDVALVAELLAEQTEGANDS